MIGDRAFINDLTIAIKDADSVFFITKVNADGDSTLLNEFGFHNKVA